MSGNVNGHMPRSVTRRILRRAALGSPVVLTFRNGKPSRVFGLAEYLSMRELPQRVKPWEYRNDNAAPSDPLGAIEGRVLAGLGRDSIYD